VKKETKDGNGKTTSSSTETTTVKRHKNADGSTTVTTTNPDGTSETHVEPAPSAGSTTMDHYQDPEVAARMKKFDKIFQNLGLAGIWDIKRGPKPKGNVDPADDLSGGVSTVGSGSRLGRLGKEFLIGQPGRTDEANGGNSPSLPTSGGIFTPNIDYGPDSNKSGYVGRTRTEDASDAVESDPSLNQPTESTEEVRKLISNPKDIKKQAPNLKRTL
jgi:hypothetical protein